MRFLQLLILFCFRRALCGRDRRHYAASSIDADCTAPLFRSQFVVSPSTFKTDRIAPRASCSRRCGCATSSWTDKLELSLRSYLDLVMANNTDIADPAADRRDAEQRILRPYSIFDPVLDSALQQHRAPRRRAATRWQGADPVSNLNQPVNFRYQQTLETGTSLRGRLQRCRSPRPTTRSPPFNPSLDLATGRRLHAAAAAQPRAAT